MTHQDPTDAESLPGPGPVSWRRFGVAPARRGTSRAPGDGLRAT